LKDNYALLAGETKEGFQSLIPGPRGKTHMALCNF